VERRPSGLARLVDRFGTAMMVFPRFRMTSDRRVFCFSCFGARCSDASASAAFGNLVVAGIDGRRGMCPAPSGDMDTCALTTSADDIPNKRSGS
jgi:hypothetical protein